MKLLPLTTALKSATVTLCGVNSARVVLLYIEISKSVKAVNSSKART